MRLSPTRLKILRILDEPRRYSEIVRETGSSDKVVWQTLRELTQNGLTKKMENGRYIRTHQGVDLLEEEEAVEEFRRRFREKRQDTYTSMNGYLAWMERKMRCRLV